MNDVVAPLGRPLSDEIRHDLNDRVTGGDQEAVGVAEGGIYVQADQRLHPGGERRHYSGPFVRDKLKILFSLTQLGTERYHNRKLTTWALVMTEACN